MDTLLTETSLILNLILSEPDFRYLDKNTKMIIYHDIILCNPFLHPVAVIDPRVTSVAVGSTCTYRDVVT